MKPKHFLVTTAAIILALSLLCGCYGRIVPDAGVPLDTNYEDMEIYKSLSGAVTEESTLEEMLTAFEEMSEIPVDSYSNMFLYEVYSYEWETENYLKLHIVRQVDEPGTSEYIQLHLDIVYAFDGEMADLTECIWFDNDSAGFLSYVRQSEAYRIVCDKPIINRHVSIDSTW